MASIILKESCRQNGWKFQGGRRGRGIEPAAMQKLKLGAR